MERFNRDAIGSMIGRCGCAILVFAIVLLIMLELAK